MWFWLGLVVVWVCRVRSGRVLEQVAGVRFRVRALGLGSDLVPVRSGSDPCSFDLESVLGRGCYDIWTRFSFWFVLGSSHGFGSSRVDFG